MLAILGINQTILNLSKLPKDLAQVIIDVVNGGKMVNLKQVTISDNRSLDEVIALKNWQIGQE